MKTVSLSRFAAALAAITLNLFVGGIAEGREDRAPKILGARMAALVADCDKLAGDEKSACEKRKASASVCDEAFYAEMQEANASDRAYYEEKCGSRGSSRRAKSGSGTMSEKSTERRVRCFKEQLGSICSIDSKTKKAVCVNNWQPVDLTPYSSHNAWTLCVPHDRIDCNLVSLKASVEKIEKELEEARAELEKEQAKGEKASEKKLAKLEKKVSDLDEKLAKVDGEQDKCTEALAAIKAGALTAMKAEMPSSPAPPPTAGTGPAPSLPPTATADAQANIVNAKSLKDIRTITDTLAEQMKELRGRMARAEGRLDKLEPRVDALEQGSSTGGGVTEERVKEIVKEEVKAFSFRPSKFHINGCFSSVIGIGRTPSVIGGGICPEFDWQLSNARLAAFLSGVLGGGQVLDIKNVFVFQMNFGLKTHLTDWLDLRTSFFGRVLPMFGGGQLLADGRTADIMDWRLGLAVGLGVSLSYFDFFIEGDFGGGQSTGLAKAVPQPTGPPRDEFYQGTTWLPGFRAGIGVNF